MNIKKEDIQHVADLARIKITEAEKEKLSAELSEIIDYVKKLGNAPTENIEPISQISGLKNVAREDKITESLRVEKVLQNAPEKKSNFIKVRKIFE